MFLSDSRTFPPTTNNHKTFTQLLEENIRKVKLSTPDYRDMDPEQAIADFKQRREMYMQVYEPVDTSDGPHIKIVNSREFIGT